MVTIKDIEIFLSMKVKQLLNNFSQENIALYKNFYREVNYEDLRIIFSILHTSLNKLFSFMNDKNSSRSGHYNAHESRQLIDLIEIIRVIQANLKEEESEYSFEVNSYYEEIIGKCSSFLSSSNGSAIPEDFPKINIIEHKAIFTLIDSKTVQGQGIKSSVKMKLKGKGSYATVFKYKDPYYNCGFALKRAHKGLRPDELERFKNEYHDLKNLDSPFIIKVYGYDEVHNEYIMELADETLARFIERKNNTLSFNDRRSLVIQLLNAFKHIHSKGLLHRDISYHNILIKHYGDGSSWIKVADFGLVKRPDSMLTRQGTDIKGTINDYSDLQIIGFENYDMPHETFALAKVVYYILTGRKSKYELEPNPHLKEFISKGVSSNKEKRFKGVEEIREELIKEVFPSLRLVGSNN
ncbi:protein kinase domain-containing protein [Priestia filamentosa]|uniref:protein kinase domain-containing protein n=1 Tax=Priestia filamentosa TaxID=1402861 RepID=UPI00397BA66C